MGKKLKGGRRQILQLEEKKPPKVPSKSKVKSLIHYSDSDDDSKKSNESESSPSTAAAQNKDSTPLESQIADFFKEIDALSVPDELLEEPDKATSSNKAETINEKTTEACSSDTAVDLPASASKDSKDSDAASEEAYCPWQEICDSSTGYSYYWNVQTNEVTWDCPQDYAAYVQSLNASAEKTIHAAPQNDKNSDVKDKKKKKHGDIVVPEGAIIPISYFGNSSSSEDSSDSEGELSSDKKSKSEKVSEFKKNKIAKKVDSKGKPNEGEASEIIGPSLPPDFQFPVTESAAKETDSQMTVSQNVVHEFAKVGPSLPPEILNDIEKPSQSDLDEFPAESSTHETSWENSQNDTDKKRSAELNEKAGDASPDSTMKKGENSLTRNAYQSSSTIYGLQSVVEYDSFTDDDEEICVANISSSRPNIDEKNYEVKSSSHQKQEKTTEGSTSMKMLIETESKISNFKRKAEVLKESTKKEELIKKPKRSDVNIDSLFASHSSYGKYGFGFGWQKQLDGQNEELCTTSNEDYKTHKRQSEFKTVSFVKSEDILDLKALNDEIICDETNHTLPDESVQTNTECDQSNALEQNEETLLNNEEFLENAETNKNAKNSSDCDVGSSSMVNIKDKIDCSILNKKKKNCKYPFNAGSTSLKVDDDLDEIDKALCEALEAKKSAKNLSLKSSSSVSDVSNTAKNMLESTSTISGGKLKEAESGDENAIDADAITDDILEISSDLIDKLTFLLSAPSTHASFSGVFFQLQTRFVDWQAGALDSTYFMARLKELEQYIQHYETGVISGDWTYQWDRENKRYFFINTRTQHSQWTYPEELCNQDKSSWVQSQTEAGPSSASSFASERDDLQTVSSSSTMHENAAQKHSASSFTLESKENSPDGSWILQSSPPPPPPGVDSPPPPPHTPPPKSPPPPPPDSTETLREPEDMDLENSNDSSSFLFVNNKTVADDGRIQFISMVEPSSKRSPVSFANASIFNAVSSTSMSGCDDLSTVSKLSHSVPHSLESSEVSNVHWSRPSCSSQIINSNSTGSVLSTDDAVNLTEEKNSEIHAGSSNGVCSSQSDAMYLKSAKSGNAVSKKEKKKTKIQPGLGLKKKNIPSLVEKWQKIKEQQDREDNNPDDSKNVNSF